VHNVFLQILYLDSLEITSVDVPEDGTRCCVWTNQMVRLVSDLDTDINGNFGALQVCPHSFYNFLCFVFCSLYSQ
jgi:hypothetical protein